MVCVTLVLSDVFITRCTCVVWYTLNPFSATLCEGLTLYPVPISFPTFIANLGLGMAVLQATAARSEYNVTVGDVSISLCVSLVQSVLVCSVLVCCVLV